VARHAAADGATAHPLVAAALAGRPADVHGAHRQGRPGPIGWPGTSPTEGDGGLGWPGDLPAGDDRAAQAPPDGDDEPDDDATPRGWRRLFARRSAA
jgi:hypothetical protein